jgi:hypothetical protein
VREELTRREEALAVWEKKAKIFAKALVKFSTDLDTERAGVEATQKEYLDKMCQGLVPQVPWVISYDPIIWIRLVPSSGKTTGESYTVYQVWPHHSRDSIP